MSTAKKILILYPHFPPSNLAGVHRARLFAMHLPSFNWEPTILTVHEKYYEEKLDHNLAKLLPPQLRIVKVHAIKRFGPIGDIGLRAFLSLYKKAKAVIETERFDVLYIPIPSFYCALLGRWLHSTTNIKYGIDYIDPWVHPFAGGKKIGSRAWFATKLANILEPVAVKRAAFITGVAEGYYAPVIKRNPILKNVLHAAMPYGGEAADHSAVHNLNTGSHLFKKETGVFQFVYAGAMLPKAYKPLGQIFRAMAVAGDVFKDVKIHFIGTGKSANDASGYNIKPLAEHYGLWQKNVFEYPARIPYLDVLVHLAAADAVFILGSTEPHYTPSKIYQAVLSQKPVLAVLHQQSTAVNMLREANAGLVLAFNGEADLHKIGDSFLQVFKTFLAFYNTYTPQQVNMQQLNQYSAKAVTQQLVTLLNKVVETSE